MNPAPGPAPWPCLAARGDACLLSVSVVPNARRTEVDGLHDGALRVRLAALPIEGRANEALVAWLAKALHVPRREIELLRGDSSRRKQLLIDLPLPTVSAWLDRTLTPQA